jgi:hypothetical protein
MGSNFSSVVEQEKITEMKKRCHIRFPDWAKLKKQIIIPRILVEKYLLFRSPGFVKIYATNYFALSN